MFLEMTFKILQDFSPSREELTLGVLLQLHSKKTTYFTDTFSKVQMSTFCGHGVMETGEPTENHQTEWVTTTLSQTDARKIILDVLCIPALILMKSSMNKKFRNTDTPFNPLLSGNSKRGT